MGLAAGCIAMRRLVQFEYEKCYKYCSRLVLADIFGYWSTCSSDNWLFEPVSV